MKAKLIPKVIDPRPQRKPKTSGRMITLSPAERQVANSPSTTSGPKATGIRIVAKKKNGPQRFSQGVSSPANLLGSPNEPPQIAPRITKPNPRIRSGSILALHAVDRDENGKSSAVRDKCHTRQ